MKRNLHHNILLFLFSLISVLALRAQTGFIDISTNTGFNATGLNRGVAIGDYDNDGDDDIYISRRFQANMLYRNNGDGSYSDVAGSAGVDTEVDSHTSVWGDFDNDGHLDLYVGNREGPNALYHNNGDGTFIDIAVTAGVNIWAKPRSVLAADVDRDGYLDIYVANLGEENALFKNNGDGTFTDITNSSGTSDPQLSMGAMFFDYDNDGDPDLYLTHDANQANILYQNDGTGSFQNVAGISGTNYQGFGMGVDFGDINNDGWLDIYITNLSYNTLFLNNGDGTFADISETAGVVDPGMGWGTTFLDYDNDGLTDIYMVNDSYFSPLPNILYRNHGDNTFSIASDNSALASMFASYGTACTDINNDGLVDVFVTNSGTDGNQLFKNETASTGNYFQLKLIGTISNRAAIGAKVMIDTGGKIFTDEVAGGTGYASQNSLTLHFGLGDIETIENLEIRWPNGLIENYSDLSVNHTMLAVENESLSVGSQEPATPNFSIDVFPNPMTTELTIKVEQETSKEYDIYISNVLGQELDFIFSGVLGAGTQTLRWVPSTNLDVGMYWLTFRTAQSINTRKITIR